MAISRDGCILGRNTLDHYCMNATENQMIYRTDVLSSVWNYCKAKVYMYNPTLNTKEKLYITIKDAVMFT